MNSMNLPERPGTPTRARIQFPRRRPVAPLASLTDLYGPLTFEKRPAVTNPEMPVDAATTTDAAGEEGSR